MNIGLFMVICICMLVIGLLSHILSWWLNKYYKNKMGKMADFKKAEK